MTTTITAKANVGAGTETLAVEQIGSVLFPVTKIYTGADGVDGGPVTGANPLPVNIQGTPIVALDVNSLAALETIQVGSLPANAATETTLAGLLSTAAFNARTPALGQAAMAASQPVVIASDQSAVNVNQPGVSATGSLAALNATVELVLNGNEGFAVDVRNVFVGTITFQGTIDGTNWFPVNVSPAGAAGNVALVSTTAAVGAWLGSAAGCLRVRAIMTAFTSGSATVIIRAVSTPQWTYTAPVGATWAVSGAVTATVGTSITGGTISPLTVAGVSVEASSAKTASGNSAAAITNASGSGAIFFINVSAVSGTTPTLAVRVQVQDPVSLSWVDVPGAVTASITATSLVMLTVAPGLVEAINSKVSFPLPRTYRLAWTIGGTTPSFTFSVGAAYII